MPWASDWAEEGAQGSGCGAEQGRAASRMGTTALGGGPGGRPVCPTGLTWRLCSAASSSRCRFAQTSRCSGKVGPGPAMLGLSATSRAGGRARRGRPGPASASGLARPPRFASTPRASCAHRGPCGPAPPRQWRRRRRRRCRRRGWRAGRGCAGAGRGVGPRAPSPPAAMATAAGPARAGGGRGALPSRHGNHARQRRGRDPGLRPGLSRAGVCGGRSGGRGLAKLRPRPAGGAPGPAQTPPCGSGRGRRAPEGGAARRGAGPGLSGRARACARACAAGCGSCCLGLLASPQQPPAHVPVFLPQASQILIMPLSAGEVGGPSSWLHHLADTPKCWPA